MRKLIQAALTLSIFLAALSITTILLDHADSEPSDLFHYLTLCDGQPCYMSIVPGTNRWEGALEILGNKPEVEFGISNNSAFRPQGFSGTVLLSANPTDMVGQINLKMRPTSVNLGNLILHLGTPCAIVSTPVMIGGVFRGMSTITLTSGSELYLVVKPTILVDEINLFNRVQTCDQTRDNPQVQTWQGFKRYAN